MACTDTRGKDPNDKQNNGTVGVDVSKDYLDAHQLIDSANRRFANNRTGLHMQREEAIQAGGADLRSNPKRARARPLPFGTAVFYSRQII